MKGKILIVEDEIEIAELLRDYLTASGYEIKYIVDGSHALSVFKSFKPDMVILDIMLPGASGFDICKTIRNASNVPIILLSAKKEDTDKVLGLGLGADDYITKPFSPRELVARVQSQFRRFNDLSGEQGNKTLLQFDDLEINTAAYTVKLKGEELSFSVKEFEILYYLASNKNHALTREKIFDKIWGYNEYGDINTVTVHIRKIREKIEENPSVPKYIETVWGVGYKFKSE